MGSFTIHDDARLRKEFFVERDILETPQGVTRRIYYTFAGGALDLPVDARNNFTVVAGVQPFTGANVRLHLRANYVHVLKPSTGLSLELRTRYFYSTVPGEFDYFSPRWYAEVLPVVHLRRYSAGWRYSIAVGLGGHRSAGTNWDMSRYLNAQVTSPAISRNLFVQAGAIYSNAPVGNGSVYSYAQFSVGLTRAF
ncbi:MAG: hypothetical protein M3N34_08940 [Pseudomonadota bacterium]|nr:hypothetical protein [Pseudomonadota bacterium]